MAIRIKVASTPKELDDVYKLRYDVYVVDDQKFSKEKYPDGRMVDRFDAVSHVANILAYENDQPIATIRLNKDSNIGLPSEELFDFAKYRQKIAVDLDHDSVIVSCGMLCVRSEWRRRRDVIYALFKMAIGVGFYWGTTHSVATVSKDSASLYGRMGYVAISDPIWVEEIGNYIVPMVADYKEIHRWAFSSIIDSNLDRFWLETFGQHFERILCGPDELLFRENEPADAAFIVDEGWISLSRNDIEGKELTIATLSRGALFGELALIDNGVRSATAKSNSNSELIRIDKTAFDKAMKSDPSRMEKLLQLCANRIRRTDDLVMIMAYAPQTERAKFAINQLRHSAIPDRKNPEYRIVKVGPKSLARTAGVREHEVLRVLEKEKIEGHLDYGNGLIRFFSTEKQ